MKKTLAIAGLALWIIGSGWYYTCKIKDQCYNGSSPGQKEAKALQSTYPLLFDWESDKPLTGTGFPAWRDSLTALVKPGNVLQLTGLFSLSESNQSVENDLGLARAKMVRSLFAGIPDSLISLTSMEDNRLSPDDGNPVPALLADITVEEAVKVPDAIAPDKYTIYFPSNSAKKIANLQVDQYLDNLAIALKNSSKTVEIIGHTDNIGPDEVNYSMGLLRAESIRSVLVARGIPVARISVSSKGEEQPAGPNDTEENRAKNRRTEIVVK
jgi:outer membrane protein OmpA-like peptidoglycan-associated protein